MKQHPLISDFYRSLLLCFLFLTLGNTAIAQVTAGGQKMSRADWGATEIKVTRANGQWLISGKNSRWR